MDYWLVKTEPNAYSWADFVAAGTAIWDGVRNHQARNNLQQMALEDQVLFYHSVTERAVVGIARVTRTSFPDPTDDTGKWFAVELTPLFPLKRPVLLSTIKARPAFAQFPLLRQSRLSVFPVSPENFHLIVEMGNGAVL
jgi:predicted RNA-binding protein with PUA-like domain